MKKNTIIIILAALVVMFGLFGFAQKVKADQEATFAIQQQGIAEEQIAIAAAAWEEAQRMQMIAEEQKQIAELESIRADSLQQQLDKCK